MEMKKLEEVEEICRKLKPIIGSEADDLWYSYLAEDDKGRRELAVDIEILAEKFLKTQPLSKQKILLDPPPRHKCSGSFLLGQVSYNEKDQGPLYLRSEDFVKQVGIFAVTGEGKTNLAYLLALQLARAKVPFLVIDWKRSWRNLLSLKEQFPELKNVRVFTVGREVLPFHWNPFRHPPGSNRELWISTIADTLEKSHLSGPGVAYYFNKIYLNLLRELKDGFYPNFFDGLKEIQKVKAYERELKWKQTALRIFTSFITGSLAQTFNKRNPLRVEELLDKPVILELDLEMPKPLRIFISEIILRWIHLYRLCQGETDNLRHVLFLEEAHNLFTKNPFTKETNSLENIYREIRAFGQGIVTITQHPSLLPVYLLGNCHTQIYLGLQHEDDINTARKALFLSRDQESYLNMLNVGQCITKIKNRIDPCLVNTPLVPVSKSISDDWLRVNTPGYLPRLSNVSSEKFPGHLPADNKGSKLSQKDRHFDLLVDIFENPLSCTTERYQRLKLNPKYGNKHKNLLISEGFIQPRKIITAKGWIMLFDLSAKARLVLADMGYETQNRKEGVIHRFWKDSVAGYYRNRKLEVLVEEYINGRPDIIVVNGKARAALEIETGKSDFIKNVLRDLQMNFDEVICLATSKAVEKKINNELAKKGIEDKRLRVSNVLDFEFS